MSEHTILLFLKLQFGFNQEVFVIITEVTNFSCGLLCLNPLTFLSAGKQFFMEKNASGWDTFCEATSKTKCNHKIILFKELDNLLKCIIW